MIIAWQLHLLKCQSICLWMLNIINDRHILFEFQLVVRMSFTSLRLMYKGIIATFELISGWPTICHDQGHRSQWLIVCDLSGDELNNLTVVTHHYIMYINIQWWESAGDKTPTVIITVKTHGGILTGGNMLENHDDDDDIYILWCSVCL